MQTQIDPQRVPLKVYRSADRLTVAAPMPGIEPEDIAVEVTDAGRLILHGELRGRRHTDRETLLDEWNPGPYHRELDLPAAVDGELGNVTYGNGVVVAAFPVAQHTRPARLTLEKVGPAHGERVGNVGHPVRPSTTAEHQAARAARQAEHGTPSGGPGGA